MVQKPRPSIQQRMCACDMRCRGGCEEQREASDIGGRTVPTCGLVAREGLLAGGFQAKSGHFGGEDT